MLRVDNKESSSQGDLSGNEKEGGGEGFEGSLYRKFRPFKRVSGRWSNNRTIATPHTYLGRPRLRFPIPAPCP